MSSLIKNTALRTIDLGNLVTRAGQALPQTATANIFTVTGGRVLVTALAGLVTVALGATVTSLKLTSTPTVGAATDLCVSTAVTSLLVGQMITLPATPAAGTAPTIWGAGYAQPSLSGLGLLIPAGAVSVTTTASDTGLLQWDLTYIPFDTGASVAAA